MKNDTWDFNAAGGYTIREKYESLMQTFIKHKPQRITAGPTLMSIIETSVDFTSTPIEKIGNMEFIGTVRIGSRTVQCCKVSGMSQDTFVLDGDTQVAVKIQNFVV